MSQFKRLRYSAYCTPGSSFLWHIVVCDLEWWELNSDNLKIWFMNNIPYIEFEIISIKYMFSFKTTDDYLLWKLAWG